MGADEIRAREMGFDKCNKIIEMVAERLLGKVDSLTVTDTYQFHDYSKYVSSAFDPEEKARRRREEFPKDCEKAFAMGAGLAKDYLAGLS